jgi:uncharacterized membrane protein YidH (DUF202 family)
MSVIDPKVYFANERTFLKWLHTSVTIGSIASALLGISSLNSTTTGFDPLRVVGLTLLAISIVFCAHSLYQFHFRMSLLNKRSMDGIDNSSAPLALSVVLVVALTAVYITYIINRTAIKI